MSGAFKALAAGPLKGAGAALYSCCTRLRFRMVMSQAPATMATGCCPVLSACWLLHPLLLLLSQVAATVCGAWLLSGFCGARVALAGKSSAENCSQYCQCV